MESQIIRQLWKRWLSEGKKLNLGVDEDTLLTFEEKYKVKLPADLREFFSLMNGMDENETDVDLIRFWPIEEVKPIPEVAPAYFDSDYLYEPEKYFLFADYSIWSHAYAISLTTNSMSTNTICVIGLPQPIFLANSFLSFISQYMDGKALEFLKA